MSKKLDKLNSAILRKTTSKVLIEPPRRNALPEEKTNLESYIRLINSIYTRGPAAKPKSWSDLVFRVHFNVPSV
jgi:hypothetical protein